MSQTFTNDNIYLNGGTLLGAAGTKILGACFYEDSSSNKYMYILNDSNGLSGYKFSNHTLYGPLESGAGIWLEYDDSEIVSIDCTPIQWGNYLIVACNNGQIASFEGGSVNQWKYPDGDVSGGSPTGPHCYGGGVTGDSRITKMAVFGTTLVFGTEDGYVISYDGTNWYDYNHTPGQGLNSNGDMMGRREITLMSQLDSSNFIIYENSGRCFNYNSSTKEWTPVLLNLEVGDEEITAMLSGSPLYFGTNTGYVLYYEGDTNISATSPLGDTVVSAIGSYYTDIIVAGENGKIASYDLSAWKNADSSGSGTSLYNDGSAINNDKIVSIIQSEDNLFLFSENKFIATGDLAGGNWYEYDGDISELSYSAGTIPRNMMALFAEAAPSSWGALSYSGIFPMGSSSASGSNLYSNTHSHASQSLTTGTAYSTQADTSAITQTVMSASHTHDYSHSHDDMDHQPLYQEWRAAIVGGANSIPSSALLFFSSYPIPTGWSEATYTEEHYVKLNSSGTGGTGGAATHTHTHSNTAYGSNDATRQKHLTSYPYHCTCTSHYHTVPSHTAEPNDPTYVNLHLIHPDSTVTEIPSGVVAFFSGNMIPPGWTQYSYANNKLIRLSDAFVGYGGGSDHHGHSMTSTNTSTRNGSELKRGAGATTACYVNHYHSCNHEHTGVANNSMPLSRAFLICIKT